MENTQKTKRGVRRPLETSLRRSMDNVCRLIDTFPDDFISQDIKDRVKTAAMGRAKHTDRLPDILRLERLLMRPDRDDRLDLMRDLAVIRQTVKACRQAIESELCVVLSRIAAFAARPVCNNEPYHRAISTVDDMLMQLQSPGWQMAPLCADMADLAIAVCELQGPLTDSQYTAVAYPVAKEDVSYAAFLLKALTGQY